MFGQADLTIRQFERNDVVLEGEFKVGEGHRGQVAFSGRHAAMIDSHTVRIAVSDIGAGGIGFQVPIFLPRMLTGVVRIYDLTGRENDSNHNRAHHIAFEHAVRIRRCELVSRAPLFFAGSSFEDPDESLDVSLVKLMERMNASTCRLANSPDSDAIHRQEIDGA